MMNMNDDDETIVEFVRSDYDSSSQRARPQCRQDLVEQDITTERLHENQQNLVLGIRSSTDQKSNNKNQKLSSTQDIHRTHMNQQTTLDVEVDEVQQQTQQQKREDPLRQATVTIPRHHDRNAEVEYDSNGNLVIFQHQEVTAIENASSNNPAAYVLPPFSPPTPISQILIFGSDNSRTLIHLPTPSSTASLSSSSDDDDGISPSPWHKQVACRLGCKSEDFGMFSQSRTAKEEAVQQQYSSTQQHTMTSLALGSVPGTVPSWGNQQQHDVNVDSLDTGVHLA